MCRMGRIVALCFLVLLLGIHTVYGFKYETCVTEVPVDFINDTLSVHNCVVRIEPLADYPTPGISELTLKNGESKSFSIEINAPGIYKYKLYRINENIKNENIKYDDTVFYIDVTAASDENTEKLLTQTTVTVVNGGKTESIVYRDKKNAGNTDEHTDEHTDKDNKNSTDDIFQKGSGKSSSVIKDPMVEMTKTDKKTNTYENNTKEAIEDHTEDVSVSAYEDTSEGTSDAVFDTDANTTYSTPPQNNKPDTDSPKAHGTDVKTGDTNHQEFWLVIMLISFAVYILTCILEKRETNRNNPK